MPPEDTIADKKVSDAPDVPDVPDGDQDQAWVVIDTELSPEALLAFCRDVERLLRINSMFEFMTWQALGENAYRMHVKNLSIQSELDTVIRVTPMAEGLTIAYDDGLKAVTELRVEAMEGGSKLTIIDDYSAVPRAEREARMGEVDKSLVPWGRDLHTFLRMWKRWSGVGIWRWYMRRMWLPMKPSARRISFMLIGITAVEFVMFLFVFIIFWFELHRLVL